MHMRHLFMTVRHLGWLFLLACVACSNSTSPASGAYPRLRPHKAVRLHADPSFDVRERRLLDIASTHLAVQTGGLFDVNILYDLNVADLDTEVFLKKNVVVKSVSGLLPRAASASIQACSDATGGVLGYAESVGKGHKVFLFADRLAEDDAKFIHAAMHELLHAAGLQHVVDPPSVMSGNAVQTGACMTEADAREFCRVYHCDLSQLRYCQGGSAPAYPAPNGWQPPANPLR
jgi:hypothetical protein